MTCHFLSFSIIAVVGSQTEIAAKLKWYQNQLEVDCLGSVGCPFVASACEYGLHHCKQPTSSQHQASTAFSWDALLVIYYVHFSLCSGKATQIDNETRTHYWGNK